MLANINNNALKIKLSSNQNLAGNSVSFISPSCIDQTVHLEEGKKVKIKQQKTTTCEEQSPAILCLESIIHLTDSEIMGDLYFTLITWLNGSGIRQTGWGRRDGEEREGGKRKSWLKTSF